MRPRIRGAWARVSSTKSGADQSSTLAGRAPIRGALALRDLLDRCLAHPARLLCPLVHEELLFEISGRARRVDVVAQGGPADLDGLLEDVLDCPHERLRLRAREPARRA